MKYICNYNILTEIISSGLRLNGLFRDNPPPSLTTSFDNHCNRSYVHRITLRLIISASNCRPTPGARNVRHRPKHPTSTSACTAPKKCPAWTHCNSTSRPNTVSHRNPRVSVLQYSSVLSNRRISLVHSRDRQRQAPRGRLLGRTAGSRVPVAQLCRFASPGTAPVLVPVVHEPIPVRHFVTETLYDRPLSEFRPQQQHTKQQQ